MAELSVLSGRMESNGIPERRPARRKAERPSPDEEAAAALDRLADALLREADRGGLDRRRAYYEAEAGRIHRAGAAA